jgi:2-polyprenyl-3-methyl-5-hydroxy-6-metoxy-1,4-benzoquinol methylase
MKKQQLDDYKCAYNKKFKFYDENILMLSWYSQRVIKSIRDKHLRSIISLGIGHKIVSKNIIAEIGQHLKRYVIIEGSRKIIKEYKEEVTLPKHIYVINSIFEEFNPEEKYDAIEMGFVLEHVDNPLSIIKKYSNFLKKNGFIFIAVPNAKSLHRLIGYKAGILNNLYGLSEHDKELGHKRYFDKESLIKLLFEVNLKIVNIEGIFLKPFSTSQLKSLKLTPEVINALLSIGVGYPEISNAIYIETTL